jgi:hypothetical protein
VSLTSAAIPGVLEAGSSELVCRAIAALAAAAAAAAALLAASADSSSASV